MNDKRSLTEVIASAVAEVMLTFICMLFILGVVGLVLVGVFS